MLGLSTGWVLDSFRLWLRTELYTYLYGLIFSEALARASNLRHTKS